MSKDVIINIYKFRTVLNTQSTVGGHNIRKRKLSTSLSISPDSFSIIVDSPARDSGSLWKEEFDQEIDSTIQDQISNSISDPECIDFHKWYTESCNRFDSSLWVPLVSYSQKWRAPEDPKELSKSLYIQMPSIPKFESTSRTVKM